MRDFQRWGGLGRGIALFGLMASLAACATAPRATPANGEAPPPERAEDYYPLGEGWHWAYDVEKGGDHILAVYRVIQRKGDTATLQAGEERLEYAISPEGIARKEGTFVGDFILKSPIRAAASWPLQGGTATVTAFGKTVTVDAGTFTNCVTIEETRSSPARVVRTTYAPGTGPIAIEYLVHDLATGKFSTELRAGLRGVTRPGADPLQ